MNGAVLETFSRPALLITDAFNAVKPQARRRERDIQLMSKNFFWLYILWIFISFMFKNRFFEEKKAMMNKTSKSVHVAYLFYKFLSIFFKIFVVRSY